MYRLVKKLQRSLALAQRARRKVANVVAAVSML